jgi:ribosomal protein S18 acetylase RimI-like enzyme
MAVEAGNRCNISISAADTPERLRDVKLLFLEYERYLGVDLSFQGFDREVQGLPGEYGPPDGAIMIAYIGNEAAGCVALRRLEAEICEMKRLYVRPEHRGLGLGRKLAVAVMDRARALGFRRMRLDTLSTLSEAMRLYESLGFRRIDPYYDNPLPDVVYWELDL